jgi:hypothetical protein
LSHQYHQLDTKPTNGPLILAIHKTPTSVHLTTMLLWLTIPQRIISMDTNTDDPCILAKPQMKMQQGCQRNSLSQLCLDLTWQTVKEGRVARPGFWGGAPLIIPVVFLQYFQKPAEVSEPVPPQLESISEQLLEPLQSIYQALVQQVGCRTFGGDPPKEWQAAAH